MRAELESFFARVEGRQEWEVRGVLDEQALRDHLRQRDAHDEQAPTSGAAYLLQRRRERDLGEAVDAWVRRVSSELFVSIDGLCAASAALAPRARPGRKDGLQLVFKWALLVDGDQLAQLHEHISHLNEVKQGEGLHLKLRGPWPPYNFRHSLNAGSA